MKLPSPVAATAAKVSAFTEFHSRGFGWVLGGVGALLVASAFRCPECRRRARRDEVRQFVADFGRESGLR